MELSPEYTEELSHSLITIYAGQGNTEKAEAVWSRLPNCSYDKKWAHAEMQFLLKNNETAVEEAKECVLRQIIDLVIKLNALKDMFLQSGDENQSVLAKEKTLEVIDLFMLWKGLAAFCDVTKSVTISDGESMIKNISAFVAEKPVYKNISGAPLFDDVVIGGKKREESTVADAVADLFYALSNKMKN